MTADQRRFLRRSRHFAVADEPLLEFAEHVDNILSTGSFAHPDSQGILSRWAIGRFLAAKCVAAFIDAT